MSVPVCANIVPTIKKTHVKGNRNVIGSETITPRVYNPCMLTSTF